MKILIIAPNLPDLPNVPDEVASLSNRLDHVLLQGTVTKSEIIGKIEQEGTFEGFWFASHGNDEGVLLSNGAMFSAYDIAAYANVAQCEWVAINTCDSSALVTTIQNLSEVDVIATETENIADVEAWQFGRLLAIEYAKSGDIRKAVQSIAPGSTVHRYYRNERSNMTRQYTPPTKEMPKLAQPVRTDKTLEDKIDRLVRLVEGDPALKLKGLTELVEDLIAVIQILKDKQRDADDERAELSAKLTTAYYVLIALAVSVGVTTLSIVWLFATGTA